MNPTCKQCHRCRTAARDLRDNRDHWKLQAELSQKLLRERG